MVNKKQVGYGAAGVAAAAAGALAGYYFYASRDAKKNRKIAARWASDLKKDVVVQAKKVKTMDKQEVLRAIDRAVAAYETAKAIDPKSLVKAAKELKNNWREIALEVGVNDKRASAKVERRPAKRTAKKRATKRASRK